MKQNIKMNMKNWMVSFVLLSTVFLSCEDIVDVAPFDPVAENFFTTPEDYDDALIAAYDMLQASYLNVMVGEIASDNTLAGGESANDTPGIQEIDDMTHTPINQQLRDIWSWMFSGVNRANYIMEFQDAVDFTDKDRVLAEARFLRAYYYFELVKWFGDVPLAVDKRIAFGEETSIERTPAAQVYAQIEADLIFAASTLPVQAVQVGRADRGAAQSLLGKVYLYQDKFQEAANILQEVIDSGSYALLTDYTTMFENDNENNAESVFEVQYSDQEGAGFDCLQCSEGNIAVGFNGIRNYAGPVYESGFSFNIPTQEAYDAFEAGDVRRDVAILDINAWAAANQDFASGEGISFNTGFEHTGFYNRKYIARQGDANIGDANLTNPNNYRAIRYADVLLMAAEAYNRGGIDDGLAQQYLNNVRNRAGLGNVTSTGSDLTNAIYQERRVELMGEGHRFFDLVRTNTAAGTISGFQSGKHELFPIPRIEIELAGNRWEQNPNY